MERYAPSESSLPRRSEQVNDIEIREGRGVGKDNDHICCISSTSVRTLHKRLPGITETAKIFSEWCD